MATGLTDTGGLVSWLMDVGPERSECSEQRLGVESVADRRDDAGHTKGGHPICSAREHGDVVIGRRQGLDEGAPIAPDPPAMNTPTYRGYWESGAWHPGGGNGRISSVRGFGRMAG